jgi:hypothetical protein
MTRPVDWSPLADSDPVPGDPTEVARLARRYADTAAEVTRQAANLRTLATAEGWDSDAGREFAEGAGELAGDLEKTHHRYSEVAGALRDWSPHLDDVQARADRALQDAKAAQAEMDANRPVTPDSPPPPDAPPPTPTEVAAEKRRADAYDGASGRLEAARRALAEAVGDRDEWERSSANRIRDAIDDDGLKDSWWDKVSGWVSDNAGWIKAVTDILSWVATGLAIVALFIPGVNIIAFLAIAFAVATLVGHTVLASTGNGSWADVIIDAVGLATLGAGKIAMRGVKGAQQATRLAGSRAAGRAAASTARSATRAQRVALANRLGRGGPRARATARSQLDALKASTNRTARTASRTAQREFIDQPLPRATPRDAILKGGGDTDLARRALDVDNVAARFPTDSRVAEAAEAASRPMTTARAAFGTSASVDLLDKAGATAPLKNLPVFQPGLGSNW